MDGDTCAGKHAATMRSCQHLHGELTPACTMNPAQKETYLGGVVFKQLTAMAHVQSYKLSSLQPELQEFPCKPSTWNDAVCSGALVAIVSLLRLGKLLEVLGRLRHDVFFQLHNDTSQWRCIAIPAQAEVQVDQRIFLKGGT